MTAIPISKLPRAVQERLKSATGGNVSVAAQQVERERRRAEREGLEQAFATQLRTARLPFTRQFKAVPHRDFRWDFRIDDTIVLVEIQGGVWTRGAHARGTGINRDCEKNALAVIAGWVPLTVTSNQVHSGEALDWTARAVKKWGNG